MRILPILLLCLTAACSTTPPPVEEMTERKSAILQNWDMCDKVYKMAGHYTIHYDHTHKTRPNGEERIEGMRVERALHQDLQDNHCKRILGPYWIDY